MRKIRTKLLVSILSLSLILALSISAFFLYTIRKSSIRDQKYLSENLYKEYDDLIRSQVQQVKSYLENFLKLAKEKGLDEQEAKNQAKDIIRNLRYGVKAKGYFWVDNLEAVNIIHPNRSIEGKNRLNLQDKKGVYIIREVIRLGKQEKGGFQDFYFPKLGSSVAVKKRAYSLLFKPWGWVISTGNYLDDIESVLDSKRATYEKQYLKTAEHLIILLVILLVVAVVLSLFTSKVFSKPIAQTQKSLKEVIETNNLNLEIPVTSKDEMGETATYINDFIKHLKQLINDLKEDNLLLRNAVEDIAEETQTSSNNFERRSKEIESVSNQIQQEKEIIQSSTQETLSIIQGISEIAAKGEKIENQIKTSSEQLLKVDESIKKMSELSEKGEKQSESLLAASDAGHQSVQELWKAIEEVSNQADRIVEMVQLIVDISEQTNLLAMNAAIEAAHAGEYGKGFAVVAEEIRKLADKSGSGAKEIREVVTEIVSSIDTTGKMVEKTNQSFDAVQKGIVGNKENSRFIHQAVNEQKYSNHEMVEVLEALRKIGDEIAEQTQKENQKGGAVSEKLKNLENFNLEITNSMQEQKEIMKKSLDRISSLKEVSHKLKEISDRIDSNFSRFKS